ncbi:MAG: SMC-Scp complex subunit ScpB [Lachnospiraceae bacterium]|nr:SMC-Scp complex subunit ScpB [Lachnospiraceae bacterium]
MDMNKLAGIIEAVLFTSGDSVEIERLKEITEATDEQLTVALGVLEKRYESEESGLVLIQLEDSVQLATKSDMYEYLIKIARTPKQYRLSDTALETLSIIAYKQPVTRMQIEHIRGVSCSHAIDRLLEYDLIKELGRLDAPGRPLLFGTTEEFLRRFGVKSIEDLPKPAPERIEEFHEQAEAEAAEELDEDPEKPINIDV